MSKWCNLLIWWVSAQCSVLHKRSKKRKGAFPLGPPCKRGVVWPSAYVLLERIRPYPEILQPQSSDSAVPSCSEDHDHSVPSQLEEETASESVLVASASSSPLPVLSLAQKINNCWGSMLGEQIPLQQEAFSKCRTTLVRNARQLSGASRGGLQPNTGRIKKVPKQVAEGAGGKQRGGCNRMHHKPDCRCHLQVAYQSRRSVHSTKPAQKRQNKRAAPGNCNRLHHKKNCQCHMPQHLRQDLGHQTSRPRPILNAVELQSTVVWANWHGM